MGRKKKFDTPTKTFGIRLPEDKYEYLSGKIKKFVNGEGKHPIMFPTDIEISNCTSDSFNVDVKWGDDSSYIQGFYYTTTGDSIKIEPCSYTHEKKKEDEKK